MQREALTFDIVIVGAGPAGLAAAIRLGEGGRSVCVLEKGAAVGAHILSGAVMDPSGLDDLFPGGVDEELGTPVARESMLFLTETGFRSLPVPAALDQKGGVIISLGRLCRWLAGRAEALGVEIFPGFAAVDAVWDDQGAVCGVVTGEMGRDRDGEPTARYQPGVEVRARQTILAEGARGSLTKKIIRHFLLDGASRPQTYALGIKELWEADPAQAPVGSVTHTVGWPLDHGTYGGGFLYHGENNRLSVGLVTGLDYENPRLSPFEAMQRFKTHPALKGLFDNARRIGYGARALVEGGPQSLPKLTFPGGLLAGDAAGFLNPARLKGIHPALISGAVAGEAVLSLLAGTGDEAVDYPRRLRARPFWKELRRGRNVRPGFKWGLWPGMLHAGLDQGLFRGRAPWTLGHEPDPLALKPLAACPEEKAFQPDGTLTFDRLSSLPFAHVGHEENQPCHLKVERKKGVAARFGHPETRYCPARVFEIVEREGHPLERVHAANCLHCKACDIKDPGWSITWTPPEGGGGPNYSDM